MLSVQDVHVALGGVKALQGVGSEAVPGVITAIIGPNGAGKTSLFNLISEFHKADRGIVQFDRRDITGLRPDRRAAPGMAKTFQKIALFRDMSFLDNAKLGAHVRLKTGVFGALKK